MTTVRTETSREARPRRRDRFRYGREIALVLVVKVLALVTIWQLWFSPPSRPHVDAAAVAERIYSSGPGSAPERERHARP